VVNPSLAEAKEKLAALELELHIAKQELYHVRGSMRTFLPHYLPRLRKHLSRRWIDIGGMVRSFRHGLPDGDRSGRRG
jgi:hypothetical protein